MKIVKKKQLIEYQLKVFGLYATLVIGLFTACKESSYQVEMLAYDAEQDSLVYQVNTIETLYDINSLNGRATEMLGGTSIEIDYESNQVRWNRVGTPVAFNAVKSGDTYYPEDYNSLAMVSIYYAMEQAMKYFESIGMKSSTVGSIPTHFWANVLEIGLLYSDQEQKSLDNAFYLAISQNERSFYILPFDEINSIPLSMNPGVLTHEYSHAVFQAIIYDKVVGGEGELDIITSHYLYGLNEGIADIFAIALTGDPDFMRHSIDNVLVTRDARQTIKYTSSFETYIGDTFRFDAYQIGAFVSAAIYDMERRTDGIASNEDEIPSIETRRSWAIAVYNTLFNIGERGPELFELPDFFNALNEQLNETELQIACEVLLQRYAMHYNEIVGCQ